MTQTKKFLICALGIIMVCLLTIGTVSAYDSDTACTSLKEVIAASGDLDALELVYGYSDGSIGYIKIWTDNCPDAREEIVLDLQDRLKSNEDKGRTFSKIVFTAVNGEKRTSYELSQKQSIFKSLLKAVEFPVKVPEIEFSTGDDARNPNLVKSNPLFEYYVTQDGSYYTQYAHSYTSPLAYYPFMTVDTYIQKRVGLSWQTSRFVGSTLSNVHEHAQSDGPFTLSTGTYRQKAHFSGVRDDYSQYSVDYYGPEFSV